ncbi:MAG: hypothetical protein MZW92_09720 [Comamonadaceae bacterium]|nr:hypothetical protein [Comamonadaceae bacterium]
MPRSIFITGASSGIGEALAARVRASRLRRSPSRRVVLERLEALAARLHGGSAPPRVLPLALDVTDFAADRCRARARGARVRAPRHRGGQRGRRLRRCRWARGQFDAGAPDHRHQPAPAPSPRSSSRCRALRSAGRRAGRRRSPRWLARAACRSWAPIRRAKAGLHRYVQALARRGAPRTDRRHRAGAGLHRHGHEPRASKNRPFVIPLRAGRGDHGAHDRARRRPSLRARAGRGRSWRRC